MLVRTATTNFDRFVRSGCHRLLVPNFFWFLLLCIVSWTIVIVFFTSCLDIVRIHSFIHYKPFSAQVNIHRKCANVTVIYQIKMFYAIFWKSFCSEKNPSIWQANHSRLWDQRPWTTLVQMSLSWFLGCIAVLMLQIITVFGRALTKLRYSQSPGRRVPNRSNTGESKWRSWRLSFVAEVTNEDHATQFSPMPSVLIWQLVWSVT